MHGTFSNLHTEIKKKLISRKLIHHSFIHSLSEFNLPITGAFTWLTPPGPYIATTCRERELTLDHIHTFLTTLRHDGPPWMSDQLNAGATSETTRTWKTIHTLHSPIHSNKTNMKGWLWRPDDIWGPCGPKASWHSSYKWGKTPKIPHPGNLSRAGIEPGPAAWQARMLPPVPRQWTDFNVNYMEHVFFFK